MSSPVLTLSYVTEPLLTFGYEQKMEHPKDGLTLFGPVRDSASPTSLRLGIIGTPDGIKRFKKWTAQIRQYVKPYKPDTAHHSAFPGFEAAFKTVWPLDPMTELIASPNEIKRALRLTDRHDALYQTVSIFARPIIDHCNREDAQPDFWFVVIPEEVHSLGRPKSIVPTAERIKSDLKLRAKDLKKFTSQPSFLPEINEQA